MGKYIIFADCFPVVFHKGISHDSIKSDKGKPTSAGFYSVITIDGVSRVKIYGRSESLDIDMGPDDEKLIHKLLFGR